MKFKVLFTIVAIVAILAFIGARSSASNPSVSTSAQSNSPTPTPQISKQMKDDYTAFYKQYMSIANRSDTANTKVINDLNNASSGSSNLTTADLYLEASDAQDTQNSLGMETVSLQIPDSLSNYHDDLQKADDSLFTLVDSRKNAMKSMADYLNGGDLSKIKDMRDNTKDQDSEMLNAAANLIKVGAALKIDTSKIK